MNAEDMLKKMGYKKDKEPRFTSLISYTKYCNDGCCRINDLIFYINGVSCDETFITFKLLQAINKQIEELGRLDNE